MYFLFLFLCTVYKLFFIFYFAKLQILKKKAALQLSRFINNFIKISPERNGLPATTTFKHINTYDTYSTTRTYWGKVQSFEGDWVTEWLTPNSWTINILYILHRAFWKMCSYRVPHFIFKKLFIPFHPIVSWLGFRGPTMRAPYRLYLICSQLFPIFPPKHNPEEWRNNIINRTIRKTTVWSRQQSQRLMVKESYIFLKRQEFISLCYHIYYRNYHINLIVSYRKRRK